MQTLKELLIAGMTTKMIYIAIEFENTPKRVYRIAKTTTLEEFFQQYLPGQTVHDKLMPMGPSIHWTPTFITSKKVKYTDSMFQRTIEQVSKQHGTSVGDTIDDCLVLSGWRSVLQNPSQFCFYIFENIYTIEPVAVGFVTIRLDAVSLLVLSCSLTHVYNVF
jgi:hypothetical protein